ncbi:MAG: hydroxymethylglutaryl-CoA lyase, partial [Ignavibacteria bacterium]|nr:hydroxymethylglutaryl-CoA lyase [Ignavibacteria bacterium]
SPHVIPQMADSVDVIRGIHIPEPAPELMVLVVNKRGVETALKCHRVQCLSYPFSVSPTFLKRNLNTDEKGSLEIIREMKVATEARAFEWVIYLSMALGNPYGDEWNTNKVVDGASKLYELGIRRMPLSDILGSATPETIYQVYNQLIPAFPDADFGLHLHTKSSESYDKLEAAWEAGVRSYETVINGLGGCPTAADEMVGNLSTQDLLSFCEKKGIPNSIDKQAFESATNAASQLINAF